MILDIPEFNLCVALNDIPWNPMKYLEIPDIPDILDILDICKCAPLKSLKTPWNPIKSLEVHWYQFKSYKNSLEIVCLIYLKMKYFKIPWNHVKYVEIDWNDWNEIPWKSLNSFEVPWITLYYLESHSITLNYLKSLKISWNPLKFLKALKSQNFLEMPIKFCMFCKFLKSCSKFHISIFVTHRQAGRVSDMADPWDAYASKNLKAGGLNLRPLISQQ